MRECKCGCGISIDYKHPNAKFHNSKHKDRFHNQLPTRIERSKKYTTVKEKPMKQVFSNIEKLLDDKINHPFADMSEYGDRG